MTDRLARGAASALAIVVALGAAGAAHAQDAADAGTPPPPQETTPPPPGGGGTTPPAGEGGEAGGSLGSPEDATGEAAEAPLRLVVVDAAPYGIDPVVGQHVTVQMRTTGGAMGYQVLTREETVAAARNLRMPYPPSPADLWRVTWTAEAQRGAFARVWAHQGRYVTEIAVASVDGTGPFFARATSGAEDLRETVDRLLRQALPATTQWNAAEARRLREQSERPAQPQQAGLDESGLPSFEATQPPAIEQPEPEIPIGRRWNLVLQTEGAIGASQDSFYNHLLGVRVDYRLSREVLMGWYVAYANLRGKDGRASNVLMYMQLEDRVRISSNSDLTVPLRLAIGYLPFNGPVIRLAAGLNIPLGERTELGFDILTPTFWVLPDRTAVTLDLGVEFVYRL